MPDTVTKLVPTGFDDGEVGDAVGDVDTVEVVGADELGAAGALLEAVAVPGRHSGVVNQICFQ